MTSAYSHKKDNLRGVQLLKIVLFGAFAYFYVSTLQGERIAAYLRQFATTAEDMGRILEIMPWHLGLVAMAMAVFLAALWVKYVPTRYCKWPLWQKMLVPFALILFFCSLTSPKEEQTIEQRMERLNLRGEYAAALKAGATREAPSAAILEQRITALEHLGTLNEDFFQYPIGDIAPYLSAYVKDTLRASPEKKAFHCLLSRDLAQLAKICKTLPSDSLKRAEAEALVLYAHTWLHPEYVYSDAAMEANYSDFQKMRKELRKRYNSKQTFSMPELNLMREAYGQTYWYYYYYGQR